MDALVYRLARQGYGSIREIQDMDPVEFLDLVEFENIQQDLELHHIQNAGR